MPNHNLLRNVAIISRTTTVTGSTANANLDILDRSGYEGVTFQFLTQGTPSTVGSSIKLQEGTSSGGGDMADITGATVSLSTAIVDGYIGIDLFRPTKQYVRAVHVKTSTADILDGGLVLGFRPAYAAVTHSTAKGHGVAYVQNV